MIAILKQQDDQAVARPFARVATQRAMIGTLSKWWDQHGHGAAPPLRYRNLDTDEPVLEWRRTKFYAFTEEAHQ